MKTMRFLFLSFAALSVAFTGCKKYDDSELRGKIADHETRITSLESAVSALDAQIKAGAMISSVTAIEGGWQIAFTGGTTSSIDILHGEAASNPDPTDGKTPMLDVRNNADGTITIWVDYGNGWADTGTNIRGPQGGSGGTPVVTIVDGKWYINGEDTGISAIGTPGSTPVVTIVNGKWHINGEDTGVSAIGTPGTPGVSPKIKVESNEDGTTSIWYNITANYPADGWVDTGYDISAIGPVLSIVDNEDGTVTVTMNDAADNAPDPATAFTFEKASPAFRFEILSYEAVSVGEGETGTLRFVVNPSTAWIPTTGDGGTDKWYLNGIGTRAPGYVQPSGAFEITKIEDSSNGRGEYVATIACREGSYDTEANDEHIVALVLNAGSDAEPVLVSSSTFSLFIAPPTTYTLGASTLASFGELAEGYAAQPAARTVTVTNTGTGTVTLTQPTAAHYLIGALSKTELAAEATATFTVQPRAGLAEGSYDETITVNGSGGATASVDASFTVTEAPDPRYHDAGVVINGVTWATRNVGASGEFAAASESYGDFYTFDAAQSACPDGWRTPTVAEFEGLIAAGGESATVNDVQGRWFGSVDNRIFMPTAGFTTPDDGTIPPGYVGYYWSSEQDSDGWYQIGFYSGGADDPEPVPTEDYAYGLSVRCVRPTE